jgi:hypothetical protein
MVYGRPQPAGAERTRSLAVTDITVQYRPMSGGPMAAASIAGGVGSTTPRSGVECRPLASRVAAEALPLSVSLVPEVDVTDLDSLLAFFVRLIGFERRRERFAYRAFDRAELMVSGAEGPGVAIPHRSSRSPIREERSDAKMPLPLSGEGHLQYDGYCG